jgi:lipopolysaccharide export system protein LptA
LRTDTAFFYFQEWEPIEQTGKVRFGRPAGTGTEPGFAMIWRPKGHHPAAEPYIIVSDSALVEFAEKFEIRNPRPGRVIGGALEGKVRIRGPEALLIDTQNINFSEGALRVWSDHLVKFFQGPHSGRGLGLELDLIPASGPLSEDKPAVTGVRTLRLRKDVAMELVSASKTEEKPDETVFVDSQGAFEYEVEAHVATFHDKVRVKRPTEKGQADSLDCELLTLVFEPEEGAPGDTASGAPGDNHEPSNPGAAAPGKKLAFRRLRAEGQGRQVVLVSQRSEMQGWMNDLTYDAQARVVTLRHARHVRLLQRNNELLCPEITVVLEEKGEIERAICRGAGKLFSYAKADATANPPPKKKVVELAAEWQKQLQKMPDARTGLDLIEFEGRAVLNRPGRESLQGDIVRIWVTPRGQPPENADRTEGAALAGADEKSIQPRRMLALHDVSFASPQIAGQTERLEVWFDEGSLPSSGQARETASRTRGPLRPKTIQASKPTIASKSSPARSESPLRMNPTSGTPDRPVVRGQSPGATPGRSPSRSGAEPGPRSKRPPPPPEAPERESDNPLSVTADLIQVRTLRESDTDDPQIAEVSTRGNVHITQEHRSGEAPLDLRGNRLDLWNYADSNQVLSVVGQPAHVRDRGMHLEGPVIHFDRGQNQARVTGAGVLRLPVKNDLDGKPLAAAELLDVFWHEKMDFDGEIAKFYDRVRTQLGGNEMHCEEMHVIFARRISFAADAPKAQETEVKFVLCRDNVELKNHEYNENKLVGVRTARGFEFTIDRLTGRVTSRGPGTLVNWRRGNGKRAGLEPTAGVRANRPLAADTAEWEYTRIKFDGEMEGNTNDRVTTFHDRVRVVYGPVAHPTDEIDEDSLPKDGGWMRCDTLQLTQHPESKKQPSYIDMVATGNTELDGRSFHALAHTVTYDESKGLYILSGDGKRDAKIWRETTPGGPRSEQPAQRMEFNPAKNELKIDRASGGQWSR